MTFLTNLQIEKFFGRTASCIYNGSESSSVINHQGIPQGSCLSPMLFNAYVSSYPHTANLVTFYADDYTPAASDTDVYTKPPQ